jgi:HSP20 family protein
MALIHRDGHVVEWPTFGWPERWRRLFELEADQSWLKVEEFHDGDTLVVRAELPDVDPEKDVEVTTADGVVTIHARREQKAEHKDKEGYRSEFRYGELVREIALPQGVTSEDVKATYSKGILEVRIPCPEHAAAAPTKVPITSA